MAYGVHISRRQVKRGNSKDISVEEWLDLVGADNELEHRPFMEITNPVTGESIRRNGDGIAVWRGHPKTDVVWFTLSGGEITLGNPDRAVLLKMHEIAAKLEAEVRGDEGELFEL